ncbi:MAG: alpha/beta hydrolase [Pyrinomonadaceae bacterium]|jgi:pimeloyl-ACP methyl ester carboxylesterase|nr:alpha/beta hydrolase [Pyrinomonadaceae bacterium]
MNLFYKTHGTGEPLVLISGFASGAWLWFRQIDELTKYFQVITFDPRGIGNSKIDESGSVTISEIADDVAKILDELNIKKASILGTSFGGFVAQEFALKYPERLDKLILACTSFGGKNHVLPHNFEVLTAFGSTENLNSAERIRKFMIPAFTKEFVANNFEIVDQTCKLREQNEVPENVYLQQLQSATTFDKQTEILEIKANTLVITGDSDQVVPMQNSINLSNLIPNSKLEIIENSGHLFFIEQAEKFNKIVINFLNR